MKTLREPRYIRQLLSLFRNCRYPNIFNIFDSLLIQTVIQDLDNGLDGPITCLWLNYKASPRAYKAPKATEFADMFGASPNYSSMVGKILNGEMGKGMKF